MAFLSKKNADIVYEVISETFSNIDYATFNKLFLEFGQASTNSQVPVMEMNKQFIRTIQARYQQHQYFQQQPQQLAQTFPTNMPSRPQGVRSKNVTFDQELELHKQHFQQFAAPPPPTPPIFKDSEIQPVDDLSLLMQRAMSERNYDAAPPPPPPRKLQIGSVIEDEKHKDDMIDIDKFLNQNKNKKEEAPVSSFDFFSKLKPVKQESEPDPISVIEIKPSLHHIPPPPTQNEPSNADISTKAMEELIQKVNELSKELKEQKEEIAALKKYYIPELKETPTLQDK